MLGFARTRVTIRSVSRRTQCAFVRRWRRDAIVIRAAGTRASWRSRATTRPHALPPLRPRLAAPVTFKCENLSHNGHDWQRWRDSARDRWENANSLREEAGVVRIRSLDAWFRVGMMLCK